MKQMTELLAPAGSYESLVAAVNAGADAVYMGGIRFGARAYADNPEEKEMIQAIRFAHLHGCSLYMTVNTLLKDGEMEDLGAYIKPYYESGLDAVIVQDLGVLSYIREQFPDLSVHASTQMTILGSEGAAFLKSLGATRIVTARELSLREIQKIHDEVDIEIESFIHGALCYCYSGQCLFSSMLGGRSGNRGRCAQPCRLPYQLKAEGKVIGKKEEPYLLSPKDMCTIRLLPEILEAGVFSLKIEGRMKRPEYTAGVVRIYRKYLNLYLEKGREAFRVNEADYKELQTLYSRGGFSDGYYKRQNGRELMSLSQTGGHFDRQGKQNIREKQTYDALLVELKKNYVETEKKEKIKGSFRVSTKFPMNLMVESQGIQVEAVGEPAQTPLNQPMTVEALEKQLRKTGDTPFVFEKLTIEADGDVFVPVKQLNALRREALEQLAAVLADREKRPKVRELPRRGKLPRVRKPAGEIPFPLHVQVEDPALLKIVLPFSEVKKIYLTSELLDFDRLGGYAADCHRTGKDCVLVLPAIFRLTAKEFFLKKLEVLKAAGLDAVVAKNLEEIGFLKEQWPEIPVILDHNLYTFNRETYAFWEEKGMLYDTLPLELNEKEIRIRGCRGSELLVYGHLPLMVTAGCLHKTMNRCNHREETWKLTDRYQKEFPVRNYCRFCYNVILNSAPLSLLGSRKEVERLEPGSLRLCFTMEDEGTVCRTLNRFADVFCQGREAESAKEAFTKGHLKRGVE